MNEFDWSIIFETKIVFLTASMSKNSFQIFIYPSKLKILNVRWYVLEHISLFESLKEQVVLSRKGFNLSLWAHVPIGWNETSLTSHPSSTVASPFGRFLSRYLKLSTSRPYYEKLGSSDSKKITNIIRCGHIRLTYGQTSYQNFCSGILLCSVGIVVFNTASAKKSDKKRRNCWAVMQFRRSNVMYTV